MLAASSIYGWARLTWAFVPNKDFRPVSVKVWHDPNSPIGLVARGAQPMTVQASEGLKSHETIGSSQSVWNLGMVKKHWTKRWTLSDQYQLSESLNSGLYTKKLSDFNCK